MANTTKTFADYNGQSGAGFDGMIAYVPAAKPAAKPKLGSNTPTLRANMEAFLKGSEGAEGGRAGMSVDMVDYLGTPIVYTYKDKDGTEYRDDFAVRDLILRKPRNADGSESKTVQGHRREAALCSLFGFESYAIPDRMRTALDRIVPEAIALAHYFTREDGSLGVRMHKVPGDLTKTSKRVIGGIPAADMFDLTDNEGNLNTLGKKSLRMFPAIYRAHNKRDARDDAELTAFMLAYEVEADGRASSLFGGAKALTSAQFLGKLVAAAIKDGVLPAPASRDTKGKADKGTDFKGSAATVLAGLDAVLTNDESDTAFDPEIERLMDNVAERWAAYRSAFPRLI